MDAKQFRHHAHEVADWIADYLENADRYPVLSRVEPGEIAGRLPASAPERGEAMEDILADFQEVILPGVTHWNHPRFFAYFPANNSAPSILGEMLSAGLGVNAMLWQTCPAATELEERVMDWLRQLIGLPEGFRGSIQDTASTATLCALVAARERATAGAVNRRGFAAGAGGGALRVYASREAHSSVEKGARIAGFGSENVVRVDVDAAYAMRPDDLERRIVADVESGRRPCCVVATVGTTSSTAVDPLGPVAEICRRHGAWLHVDAALAGSAAILPEMRWLLAGADGADSLVFNPHKWLLTNFDCSAFFVRDARALISSLAIDPEYLRTDRDREVTNYRDWSVPLGRRFRALKLWFVLRSYGVEGLRALLREHLRLAAEFAGRVEADPDFELLAPVPLNTVCFRFRPGGGGAGAGGQGRWTDAELDAVNKELLDEVNAGGRIYMTHTRLDGRFTLRLCVGQTGTRRQHVEEAWRIIRGAAIVRRHQSAPPAATGGEDGPGDRDRRREEDDMAEKYVKVAVYTNEAEAYVGKGLLETAGLEVFLQSDDAGGMYPQLAYSGGIGLLVRERDADEAKRILESESGASPAGEGTGDQGEEGPADDAEQDGPPR